MLKRISIEAISSSDAWFQLVYAAVNEGREFKIDRGSYAGQIRLEFDWVDIHILKPWLRDSEGLPLIPEVPEGMNMPAPTTKEYVRGYGRYIMTGVKEPGEDYTYGERFCAAVIDLCLLDVQKTPLMDQYMVAKALTADATHYATGQILNQIEAIIYTYKVFGARNNQMVLQVAQPSDLLLEDPPCLRHIDTRIQDGQLHFFPYFRSWDLWGGFPANIAGISMLQEHMANEIGVAQGEMICSSKGLHIYGYAKDLAKLRTGVQ